MKRNQKGEVVIGTVIFVLLALGVIGAGVTGKTATAEAAKATQVAEAAK